MMRFRLRGALSGRHLLAPLVALVAVQAVGLAGGRAPAAVGVVTAIALALPVTAWVARQVLDAEPDEQVRMNTLAVGGPIRGVVAGQLAAYAVVAPLVVLCASASLLHVDNAGIPEGAILGGLALALTTALAAVAIGALAARAVAGANSVVVLVALPVLVAVVGLSRHPAVAVLVPRLDTAIRAAYDGRFSVALPAAVTQMVLWSAVVLGLRLFVRRN